MAAVKSILARRFATVGPLLAQIAVESAASGGDGAERVLFHLMQVLEAVGYSEALGEIEVLYDSPVPQVRMRAAYAAGRLGAVEAVERLLDLLEDEEEDVRYEASESVWRLTGLDFEFEPSAPVEQEQENLARLRETWQRSGKSAHIRGKITLADLFGRRP
ncbi:MAG: HEAT repeat domain-containing protein [Planctomycetes bacterium]|nr:HEAT repeat domain-containing protein [Planctomycetota bacterium]